MNLNAGCQRRFQGPYAAHAVVVRSRPVDSVNAMAQRIEEESEVSIGATYIQQRLDGELAQNPTPSLAEHLVEPAPATERVIGIPGNILR
jgi:hypothetical protein